MLETPIQPVIGRGSTTRLEVVQKGPFGIEFGPERQVPEPSIGFDPMHQNVAITTAGGLIKMPLLDQFLHESDSAELRDQGGR